ncbi:MAG: hypothetical protein ACLSFV_07665 [Bacteroides xylanisolvens]
MKSSSCHHRRDEEGEKDQQLISYIETSRAIHAKSTLESSFDFQMVLDSSLVAVTYCGMKSALTTRGESGYNLSTNNTAPADITFERFNRKNGWVWKTSGVSSLVGSACIFDTA